MLGLGDRFTSSPCQHPPPVVPPSLFCSDPRRTERSQPTQSRLRGQPHSGTHLPSPLCPLTSTSSQQARWPPLAPGVPLCQLERGALREDVACRAWRGSPAPSSAPFCPQRAMEGAASWDTGSLCAWPASLVLPAFAPPVHIPLPHQSIPLQICLAYSSRPPWASPDQNVSSMRAGGVCFICCGSIRATLETLATLAS